VSITESNNDFLTGNEMITSCQDCKTKCCKTGPGPYKRVPQHQYLKNFESHKNYNVACEHFDLVTEKCEVWNTPRLPRDCAQYVCHVRSYSEKELKEISELP